MLYLAVIFDATIVVLIAVFIVFLVSQDHESIRVGLIQPFHLSRYFFYIGVVVLLKQLHFDVNQSSQYILFDLFFHILGLYLELSK